MKRMILLCILINSALYSYSQTPTFKRAVFEIDPITKLYTYQDTLTFKNISKTAIFQTIKIFCTGFGTKIGIEDVDAGLLTGWSSFKDIAGDATGFDFKYEIKDNKLRFTFENINCYESSIRGPLEREGFFLRKPFLKELPLTFNLYISDLQKQLLKRQATKDF